MLVLGRRAGEKVLINGGEIVVTVEEIRGDKVKLSFVAPPYVTVDREEVYAEKQRRARGGSE